MSSELARVAVAPLPVAENLDHQRRDLERHGSLVGDLLEQADVLQHEVHAEGDVARAVEDHLAFRLVHEGIARRNPDRLVGGGKVHAGRLHGRQRLAQRQQIGGRQVVGHHLERRGAADLAGMQDAPAEDLEHRQHPLEDVALAAGKDRDVAGRGAVHAARYRTVDSLGAGRLDQRRQAADFGGVGGRHFQPDLARPDARQDAVGALHHGS